MWVWMISPTWGGQTEGRRKAERQREEIIHFRSEKGGIPKLWPEQALWDQREAENLTCC